MADELTIGSLLKSKVITPAELSAAVGAYLMDPAAADFRFGEGHVLDLATAVDAHEPSRRALADPKATAAFKRTMVQTAIILARPSKG
ncbi:hypothetical protein MCBMB27_05731 (plasmid) [Methylobacterium phyllosphaerae]|uniref:Uncharacterized protein n=1 Tax=Methylobacterium phyllosphaerae TaxID=418223 RepID=A0AAE8HXU9_9HYPH|nr:hypothetical protein [Methylobacterium phyllosphaerae]APT35022.1 hypothetical protein MCBMB27_05731 [Methylobacterium phyllosphaerae]SFH67239.1 hypothetical protein SAMN05192567_14215 [Methylobacterium phyllosphaerae]